MFDKFDNLLQVDVHGWRLPTLLFKWMGMNALLMYTLVACGILPAALKGFYWGSPDNNLVCLHYTWHFLIANIF
jgi:heparan-alpha-glucosaminide N-acetyltransferase